MNNETFYLFIKLSFVEEKKNQNSAFFYAMPRERMQRNFGTRKEKKSETDEIEQQQKKALRLIIITFIPSRFD
jgi:hypothetical protein